MLVPKVSFSNLTLCIVSLTNGLLNMNVVFIFLIASTLRQQPVDSLLIDDILADYDPRVLARVDNNALLVKVGFTLVQLHSLVSAELITHYWFFLL